MQYTVLPRDDGQAFEQSWMVHENGQMKSSHTTKQAALNAARGYASDGDTLEVRRIDGTIQKSVTVRDASGSDDESSSGFFVPGFGDNDHGEGTLDVNDLL